MSKINDLQFTHTWRIGKLIEFAYQQDYRLSFGCARCAKVGHHMTGSLHYLALATDLNLFIKGPDGKWHYTSRTEDHLLLGEFWETMGGTWGGRFSNPDGNHYSTEFKGRR